MAAKFTFDKTIVKPGIVCDENATGQKFTNLILYFAKRRCVFQITCCYASKHSNLFWKICMGIDQRLKCPDDFIIFNTQDANFNDSIIHRSSTGCFNVNKSKFGREDIEVESSG